jgi:hypothetical protein
MIDLRTDDGRELAGRLLDETPVRTEEISVAERAEPIAIIEVPQYRERDPRVIRKDMAQAREQRKAGKLPAHVAESLLRDLGNELRRAARERAS